MKFGIGIAIGIAVMLVACGGADEWPALPDAGFRPRPYCVHVCLLPNDAGVARCYAGDGECTGRTWNGCGLETIMAERMPPLSCGLPPLDAGLADR